MPLPTDSIAEPGQNSEHSNNDNYGHDRSIRSAAPSPDGIGCLTRKAKQGSPSAIITTNIASSRLCSEYQQPVLHSDSSSSARRSPRKGRSRQRNQDHQRQDRRPRTPPLMRAFLAKGAEQERARQASDWPTSLPYRVPNNSPENLPLNAPSHPLPEDPDRNGRVGDNDSTFPTIADQSSPPSVFHVTAEYFSRQGCGSHSKRSDTFGIWKSLIEAHEAAGRCSQLPMFQKSVVTIKTRFLSASERAQDVDTEFQTVYEGGLCNVVNIEIVEHGLYMGE